MEAEMTSMARSISLTGNGGSVKNRERSHRRPEGEHVHHGEDNGSQGPDDYEDER